jgi:hypothetical protein
LTKFVISTYYYNVFVGGCADRSWLALKNTKVVHVYHIRHIIGLTLTLKINAILIRIS